MARQTPERDDSTGRPHPDHALSQYLLASARADLDEFWKNERSLARIRRFAA
jgi:hypothetical protein